MGKMCRKVPKNAQCTEKAQTSDVLARRTRAVCLLARSNERAKGPSDGATHVHWQARFEGVVTVVRGDETVLF